MIKALIAAITKAPSKFLNWAKGAWSAAKYSAFSRAVSKGASAVADFCTKNTADCWELISMFL
ncbi:MULTISPECIES: hypothetical protein [Bacillus cereus group]|uniref:hypothetical protein n=1 Tax=Bacillus cereus group TaxID=86661 RepID=UPI000BEBFE52|nr:hypothetical protein [Bacillus toyonensis]MED2709029.1 hypothetical protein [Bacillus toyonensis]MED2742354.1 hypothetical protein [Bacillus toyonensis]PDZ26805.1 hypothetical protein CON85_20520 [Bacillus toyonensis]PEB17034.1 hypothetical protein COO08_19235 [Bacillus toyonensis]PEK45369.1 hypothetical protein CN592_23035 [Bacillus toyonensis]